MVAPYFARAPLQYFRYQAHEKPALFYSCVIGLMGPAFIVLGPSFRRAIGDDGERPQIPMTYPIPKGPRKIPEGYDD